MGVKVRQRPKDSGIWYVVIDHRGFRHSRKIGDDKALAEKVAEAARAGLHIEWATNIAKTINKDGEKGDG